MRAGYIRILNIRLQRAISCVLPEGLQPIERRLLNRAVVCVSRTGPAIPDNRPGFRSVGGIGEEIPSVIIRAVINRKGFFLVGSLNLPVTLLNLIRIYVGHVYPGD